jgi:hypothetical protein
MTCHLPKTSSRQFSAGCLVSALPACRIYFSIRQQQQADELPAGNQTPQPPPPQRQSQFARLIKFQFTPAQ